MKRIDEGKVSLVDFLGSIKFNRPQMAAPREADSEMSFARLHQRVHGPRSSEENQLIRSAN